MPFSCLFARILWGQLEKIVLMHANTNIITLETLYENIKHLMTDEPWKNYSFNHTDHLLDSFLRLILSSLASHPIAIKAIWESKPFIFRWFFIWFNDIPLLPICGTALLRLPLPSYSCTLPFLSPILLSKSYFF